MAPRMTAPPDLETADDQIHDIQTRISDDDPKYGALARGTVWCMRHLKWSAEEAPHLPDRVATKVIAQLNGQVKELVDAHAASCKVERRTIREAEKANREAAEDGSTKGSFAKKVIWHMVRYNAPVFGVCFCWVTWLFRAPLLAALSKWMGI